MAVANFSSSRRLVPSSSSSVSSSSSSSSSSASPASLSSSRRLVPSSSSSVSSSSSSVSSSSASPLASMAFANFSSASLDAWPACSAAFFCFDRGSNFLSLLQEFLGLSIKGFDFNGLLGFKICCLSLEAFEFHGLLGFNLDLLCRLLFLLLCQVNSFWSLRCCLHKASAQDGDCNHNSPHDDELMANC